MFIYCIEINILFPTIAVLVLFHCGKFRNDITYPSVTVDGVKFPKMSSFCYPSI